MLIHLLSRRIVNEGPFIYSRDMSPRPRGISDASILKATAQAIGRMGPNRLTLADVAKEAGIAPATLMQRFGSKRGLLLALARTSTEGETLEPFRAALAAEGPRLEALVNLLAACAGMFVKTPEELANHLAFLQIDLSDADFYAVALEQAKQIRAGIRMMLDAAVDAGELEAQDILHLAQALQASYNGSMVMWAIYREGKVGDWVRGDLEAILGTLRGKEVKGAGRKTKVKG
jgi:AcrR family transcriptional regulator